MADFAEHLRTEVVESQKARVDLLKWKIVLISALGAVGFGIGKDNGEPLPVILGFIPIVCAYVDLLCVHNDLRILVIGAFLRKPGKDRKAPDPEAQAYEELCHTNRHAFLLEQLALVVATAVVSFLIALLASFPNLWAALPSNVKHPMSAWVCRFLIASAAVGLLVSIGALVFKDWWSDKHDLKPGVEQEVGEAKKAER